MGDIPEYAPEGTLKFMPPVENPDYQIRAIKIGGILIADRNLVFLISWDDLDKQGFCGKSIWAAGGQSRIVLGQLAYNSINNSKRRTD